MSFDTATQASSLQSAIRLHPNDAEALNNRGIAQKAKALLPPRSEQEISQLGYRQQVRESLL